MPHFKSNEVSLQYEIHGEGKPVLLLHGAVVDFNYNYVKTGWVDTLTAQGYQVIGINYRGYAESDKSNDPAFYGTRQLVGDVMNLIDYLKLENVSLIGYSLGTLITLNLIHQHPEHFSKAILIATGDGLIGQSPHILADTLPGLTKLFSYPTFPEHLPSHISAYWTFLHTLELDKEAICAFSLAEYPSLTPEEVSSISIPTLIISGEKDLVLGTGAETAKTLINGQYVEIPQADHFTLATDQRVHRAAVDFLAS